MSLLLYLDRDIWNFLINIGSVIPPCFGIGVPLLIKHMCSCAIMQIPKVLIIFCLFKKMNGMLSITTCQQNRGIILENRADDLILFLL